MSKMLSIFAAVVVAFAVSGTVFADDAQKSAAPAVPAAAAAPAKAPAAKTFIRNGQVVSVDATANQLVLKGRKADTVFVVTAKTNIMKSGKEISLSDIVAGDRVTVAYRNKDDKSVATSIKVQVPKAAAPATPVAPAAPAK